MGVKGFDGRAGVVGPQVRKVVDSDAPIPVFSKDALDPLGILNPGAVIAVKEGSLD